MTHALAFLAGFLLAAALVLAVLAVLLRQGRTWSEAVTRFWALPGLFRSRSFAAVYIYDEDDDQMSHLSGHVCPEDEEEIEAGLRAAIRTIGLD